MHSNSHVGISLMAMAHLAAAMPNLTYACDTHYPWQSEEVIVGGRFEFEDGCCLCRQRAGAGHRAGPGRRWPSCTSSTIGCGLTERNDEIEMQKVDPGWKFEATRW